MPDDSADLLRRHGVQVTAQRLAVLAAVSGRPHGTADDVAKVVRTEIGAISRQAVYDALGVLADKGLIRRIQPAGSPARYEDRVGDNHHHLICRTCGRMVDVDCAVGAAPCLTAGADSGYEIDEAEVVYWGRCPECLVKRRPAPSHASWTSAAIATASERLLTIREANHKENQTCQTMQASARSRAKLTIPLLAEARRTGTGGRIS
jgi:Fur family ferric uptake transcriptional regulator